MALAIPIGIAMIIAPRVTNNVPRINGAAPNAGLIAVGFHTTPVNKAGIDTNCNAGMASRKRKKIWAKTIKIEKLAAIKSKKRIILSDRLTVLLVYFGGQYSETA